VSCSINTGCNNGNRHWTASSWHATDTGFLNIKNCMNFRKFTHKIYHYPQQCSVSKYIHSINSLFDTQKQYRLTFTSLTVHKHTLSLTCTLVNNINCRLTRAADSRHATDTGFLNIKNCMNFRKFTHTQNISLHTAMVVRLPCNWGSLDSKRQQ